MSECESRRNERGEMGMRRDDVVNNLAYSVRDGLVGYGVTAAELRHSGQMKFYSTLMIRLIHAHMLPLTSAKSLEISIAAITSRIVDICSHF